LDESTKGIPSRKALLELPPVDDPELTPGTVVEPTSEALEAMGFKIGYGDWVELVAGGGAALTIENPSSSFVTVGFDGDELEAVDFLVFLPKSRSIAN